MLWKNHDFRKYDKEEMNDIDWVNLEANKNLKDKENDNRIEVYKQWTTSNNRMQFVTCSFLSWQRAHFLFLAAIAALYVTMSARYPLPTSFKAVY